MSSQIGLENQELQLQLRINITESTNVSPLAEWDEIIKERVIGFTFCNDLLILPEDPYGMKGPFLKDILHKKRSIPKLN